MLMSSRTPRSRDEVAPHKAKRILEIGKPIEFEHGIHVEYNREKGKFMASIASFFLALSCSNSRTPYKFSFGATGTKEGGCSIF